MSLPRRSRRHHHGAAVLPHLRDPLRVPRRLRRCLRLTTPGAAWALSIIGLTMVIRAALIPLFVKQIKSSRNMQLLQPKLKELQKKYGHDRERFAAEQMKLFKESGTNPLASCLPLLLQMPIFIALFRLIDQAAQRQRAGRAHREAGRLAVAGHALRREDRRHVHRAAGDDRTCRILAAILVVAMTATTFLTQRQLMTKNMPADALTGQYAQQQKMLLYVLPARLRGRRHRLPDRRPHLLDDLEPVDDGPAVLRDPEQPRARDARRQGQGAARRGQARAPGRRRSRRPRTPGDGTTTPRRRARPQPRRQQPKKQSREQRKKNQPPGSQGKPKPDDERRVRGRRRQLTGRDAEHPSRTHQVALPLAREAGDTP